MLGLVLHTFSCGADRIEVSVISQDTFSFDGNGQAGGVYFGLGGGGFIVWNEVEHGRVRSSIFGSQIDGRLEGARSWPAIVVDGLPIVAMLKVVVSEGMGGH